MSSTTGSRVAGDELRDELGDATSVLLLSNDKAAEGAACSSLLSVVSPANAQYLAVTLDSTPDDKIDAWRADVGELPSHAGVISVGERSRSAAAASSPAGPGSTPVSVDTVADPSDLTGIAMAVGAYMDAWADTDRTPVVCFDSITSMLFHADQDRVFRFLHSTTGRLRELGAVAHYHLDPTAHDESTVNAFSALFDAVVEVDGDGFSVRKRR
ncbi:MAG: hypothetical protein U5J98_08055 [Halobacteriales archaeon]|nr:hypothetical protein [Halobacteriales archaeon]